MILFYFVLCDKLFACRGCIASAEGVSGVRAWVGWNRVCPFGIVDHKPILGFGDRAGQMAVFLTVGIVVGLCHGEDSAKLVFELVDGLWHDHAVETCQFVAEVD